MFGRDFTETSNPVNHLTQNKTYFLSLAVRMSLRAEILAVVPISSSLCVLKRCKLLSFTLVFSFFFIAMAHLPPQGKKENRSFLLMYHFIIF